MALLSWIKSIIEDGGSITFVQCQALSGNTGEKFEKELKDFFGPKISVHGFKGNVFTIFGIPIPRPL